MSLPRREHHKRLERRTQISRGNSRLPHKAEGKRRDRVKRMKAKPYRSLKTRRGLKDELDRVTSLLVRAKDGCCVTCGTTEDLQCSHYFKRRFLATRWNLQNCNAQCARENAAHNKNPFKYRAYMVKAYGEDAIDELFKLRNSIWRPTDDELRVLLEELRQQLRTIRKAA